MKIEKLRNNHKREIIIGTILTVVLGGALTFRLTHSKYRVTQSIDLATGIINYTVPDFKIMAVKISEDGETYSDSNIVPSSGYILNSTKSSCKVSDTVDNNITIEYSDGKINFLGVTKKGTKCYLYFDKIIGTTVDNIIASVNAKTTTPDFSKTATGDEGVFKAEDGMYGSTEDNKIYTYYWRGAATTNHVIFANKCWRIIRINGDKTMRLIYDGSTCHANGTKTTENLAQPTSGTIAYEYNTSYNQSNYVGWTYSGTYQRPSLSINTSTGLTEGGSNSNAKTKIESWYNSNLKSYEGKIADGKYCNDRDTGEKYSGWSGTWTTQWSATGTKFAYAGVDRLWNKYQPTFNCPTGDVYTLKVGLITADEVEFAGGKNEGNSSYYLYNGQNYWTMSPCYWQDGYAYVFYVGSGGVLSHTYVGNVHSTYGLRPVINLKADTAFATGGAGTQSNPYVVQ